MKPLDELTAHCIRCGFCLEACPTFSLTGEETESPRGRIYLIRSANEGKLAWDDTTPHLDRCLGCLACQTACPSGVEYGQIIEIARDRLERGKSRRVRKALLGTLSSPSAIRRNLALGRLLPGHRIPSLLSHLLSHQPPEADKPRPQKPAVLPALDERSLPTVKGEVLLLEGCVMRVLFPRVHQATRRLLRRVGYVVRDVPQGCCGSLHLHAGYLDEAKAKATDLISGLPEGSPVIVNSAGCGSTMKGYGDLVGTETASRFAESVLDASEFLWVNGLTEALKTSEGLDITATYHDACHLAHGQRVTAQPRELLASIPGIRLVDLPEADTCCGSAGIYNLTQPAMARRLLERKWGHIEETGADFVAMGNPGCQAWISQAAREHQGGIRVLHTLELLEAAWSGLAPFTDP